VIKKIKPNKGCASYIILRSYLLKYEKSHFKLIFMLLN